MHKISIRVVCVNGKRPRYSIPGFYFKSYTGAQKDDIYLAKR